MHKIRLNIILVIALMAVLLLSACGMLGGGADLAGTSWQLTSLRKNLPLVGSSITLNFEKDSLGGSGSCNSYGGEYKLRGDKLTISSVFSTEMYCEAAGLMDQEAAYYELLSKVTGYSLEGDVLTLTTDGGDTLVFQRFTNLPD